MRTEHGFTMIELLMVILLVAILGATALPQFLDFREEAKKAQISQIVATVRTGIKLQMQNMMLRCGRAVGTVPITTEIELNDITISFPGSSCTPAQIPNVIDRKF